jgi:2-C-methyl-D-erythritol 4-phosphate cytidylyltransferase
MEALAVARSIERVVIAAPASHRSEFAALAPTGLDVVVVAGGASRSESVGLALAEVEADANLVVVHDAARPLVEAPLLDAVVSRLAGDAKLDAVVAAAPVTDTVKRSKAPRAGAESLTGDALTVAATLDRNELWAVQTPQAFRTAALRRALDQDPATLGAATDDAVLVEAGGGRVDIEPAPAHNLKVTVAADLDLAAALLARRS